MSIVRYITIICKDSIVDRVLNNNRDSHVITAFLSNMADCELVEEREMELLPLTGAKGKVWKYFGFQARNGEYLEKDKHKQNVVFCKLCLQSIKYCGNTTNLLFHLQTKHPIENREVSKPDNSLTTEKGSSNSSKQTYSSRDRSSKASTSKILSPLQKVTDAVCFFLARDTQPYDTVNDEGFCHMLQKYLSHVIRHQIEKQLLTLTFQSCVKHKERKSRQALRMLLPFLSPQICGLHELSIHTLL